MASYKYNLPLEQWRQVLTHNSPGDLCNVVLVSRHMNSVASLPELWAGMKVNTRKVRENGLAEFYNIKRFKKVKEINFKTNYKTEEIDRMLKEIPGSPLEIAYFGGLRPLKWSLDEVSAEVVASAVSHLRIANFEGAHLTTDQCVALLKASLSSTTLTHLNLNRTIHINYSEVPAELLANSISRLQVVSLCQTHLTTVQCVALLNGILSSATLKHVDLYYVDLSKVPAELLANSISRLYEVNLCKTDLTTDQCVALLEASLASATLKNVNLERNNLSEVPAELLADSISRLQHVNLFNTSLMTDQCVALLKATLTSATLTNVNLGCVNLSEVPAELLANSISRLQVVGLRQTHLTTVQCGALLNGILSSATLTDVDLGNVNLSEVPAELLANSMSRLQHVNLARFTQLGDTFLTTDQCVVLLKACNSSSTLQRIHLRGNEITKKLASDKKYLLTTLRERMPVTV